MASVTCEELCRDTPKDPLPAPRCTESGNMPPPVSKAPKGGLWRRGFGGGGLETYFQVQLISANLRVFSVFSFLNWYYKIYL